MSENEASPFWAKKAGPMIAMKTEPTRQRPIQPTPQRRPAVASEGFRIAMKRTMTCG